MSSVAEISVQPTTDPNVKVYHTRFEMSSGPECGSRGNSEELGAFGNLVLAIPGIAQVHVCPYALMITKAPLFEWSEIDPLVEDLLKEFVISQRQIVDAYTNAVPTTRDDRVKGPRTPHSRTPR